MNKSLTPSFSARQIKAARALLDWSQDDLADASGLSIATVRKIESGQISPRGKTMEAIKRAFDARDVDFLAQDGVTRRRNDIKMFEGYSGARAFFDDVYETVKDGGQEILIVCPDARTFFSNVLREYKQFHVDRMTVLGSRVTVRCILTEDKTSFPGSAYCEYRFLPQSLVDSVPFYIYGDKCSIRLRDHADDLSIMVIRASELAQTYRRQFNSMWDKAVAVSLPPWMQKESKPKTTEPRKTKNKGSK